MSTFVLSYFAQALYRLLGKYLPKGAIDKSPAERTEQIFSVIDLNQDNYITMEEFILGWNSDPDLVNLLKSDNCDEAVLAQLATKD